MKFHVQFTYKSSERENLLRLLQSGGVVTERPLKLVGAWIAAQTGVAYAVVETEDANAIYELCAVWSDYGQIVLTPIIPVSEL